MGKCEHGKQKSRCRECGGSQICKHGKQKAYCKECGGSQICEHGKQKLKCRECGGSAFCKHDIRKSHCRECGGSAFCKHDKLKSRCKECGGSAFCEHNKFKSQCRECGGSAFCEHNKFKSQCKECGGSQICEHNKRKSECKECGGSRICKHNKRKSECKECRGSQICKHDKYKSHCKECGGSALCKSAHCPTVGIPKYNGFCMPCCLSVHPEIEVSRNYKTKENDVVARIKQSFPSFTWVADKKVTDGCSRRRPDLLVDMGSHVVIVEVDENKHTDYDTTCEHKRLMELSQDVHHRPIIFIRFNPDAYTDQDGKTVKSCWKMNKLGVMQVPKSQQKEWDKRIDTLKKQIQFCIDTPSEKTIDIIELFY